MAIQKTSRMREIEVIYQLPMVDVNGNESPAQTELLVIWDHIIDDPDDDDLPITKKTSAVYRQLADIPADAHSDILGIAAVIWPE